MVELQICAERSPVGRVCGVRVLLMATVILLGAPVFNRAVTLASNGR